MALLLTTGDASAALLILNPDLQQEFTGQEMASNRVKPRLQQQA